MWTRALPFFTYALGSALFLAGSCICIYRIFTGRM